jgi:hypothetical protein
VLLNSYRNPLLKFNNFSINAKRSETKEMTENSVEQTERITQRGVNLAVAREERNTTSKEEGTVFGK